MQALQMSLIVRKPTFYICENKDADQLRSNCAADQRLCFRYTDSTVPLLPKSQISGLLPSSVAVQPGLCGTWSETRRPVFSQRGSNLHYSPLVPNIETFQSYKINKCHKLRFVLMFERHNIAKSVTQDFLHNVIWLT